MSSRLTRVTLQDLVSKMGGGAGRMTINSCWFALRWKASLIRSENKTKNNPKHLYTTWLVRRTNCRVFLRKLVYLIQQRLSLLVMD